MIAGFGNYGVPAGRSYRRVLSQQLREGGFPYSSGEYALLSDERSYPRIQAMLLYYLLHPLPAAEKARDTARDSSFAAAS